jgi:hypothetical protein
MIYFMISVVPPKIGWVRLTALPGRSVVCACSCYRRPAGHSDLGLARLATTGRCPCGAAGALDPPSYDVSTAVMTPAAGDRWAFLRCAV